MNIVDAFLFQARHQPTALALCAPGMHYKTISYGRLAHFINNVGCRAISAGLKRGDVAAIVTGDPVLHLALVLGLTRVGVETLSAMGKRPPAEIGIDVVLSERAGDFPNAGRMVIADQSWLSGPGYAPRFETGPEYGGGSTPARIILTSGTTGDPKAVLLSHEMMLRRLQAYDVAFGNTVPTCSRFFSISGSPRALATPGPCTFWRGVALFSCAAPIPPRPCRRSICTRFNA